jgi:hypothetical protein
MEDWIHRLQQTGLGQARLDPAKIRIHYRAKETTHQHICLLKNVLEPPKITMLKKGPTPENKRSHARQKKRKEEKKRWLLASKYCCLDTLPVAKWGSVQCECGLVSRAAESESHRNVMDY